MHSLSPDSTSLHTPFRHMRGAVYILENSEARRVKVGMTINHVADRLNSVNDMWLARKVTCQICAGRLNNVGGHVPEHVVSGIRCHGSNSLPLEKDVKCAESRLVDLQNRLSGLSGNEKASATRRIKTLKKRIEIYQRYDQAVGVWEGHTAFYTESAEQVELLAHEILGERVDKAAPFGEVFCCSVSEATDAIEKALSQLGLLNAARKQPLLPNGALPVGAPNPFR
jgi:hypothetical protein